MANDIEKNAAFANIDDLFDASYDDLEELPPLGVPPSGHYNLSVSASREKIGETEGIVARFTIDAVNELENGDEINDPMAKVGGSFTLNFIPTKKDGTPNVYAVAGAKEFARPFKEHFGIPGTVKMGEILARINDVKIAASVKRRPAKDKNGNIIDDMFNARVKNIIVF